MRGATHAASRAPARARLLAAAGPELGSHRQCFGAAPGHLPQLATILTDAGLTGRGGAGFPTGRKVATAAGARGVVVIGNGAEGEPLSDKDAVLLSRAPHLVLDGLTVLCDAVDAESAYLYLPERARAPIESALAERRAAGWETAAVSVIEAPDVFIAGEETAVIRRLEGGPALPRDRVAVVAQSGLRGRPTLVNNVETLAQVGLIARFGPRWFRSVGDPAQPGTMLVTLSGALVARGVTEVPTGVSLTDLIGWYGRTDPRGLRAVLVGGYHGAWLTARDIQDANLTRNSLSRWGATPGAGIIHGLGRAECGLARTADIVAYLAREAAGQCGPCANGLPRLAALWRDLAHGSASWELVDEIERIAGLVVGRGACRHPDGSARMVGSALRAFAGDVAQHIGGRCEAEVR